MCSESLLTLYELFVQRTGLRAQFIERCFDRPPEPALLSEDAKRNESSTYGAMFCGECRSFLEKLYSDALKELSGLAWDRCEDVLNGLAFIQEVAATALWKYRCDVGPTLESFAREFDRLDLPAERHRLYQRAYQGSPHEADETDQAARR